MSVFGVEEYFNLLVFENWVGEIEELPHIADVMIDKSLLSVAIAKSILERLIFYILINMFNLDQVISHHMKDNRRNYLQICKFISPFPNNWWENNIWLISTFTNR